MSKLLTHRYVLIVVTVIILSGLAYLASQGVYSRPMNDDLFFLTPLGAPHAQYNWFYWNYNGRLSSTVLYSLLYPLPHIIQAAPFVSVIMVLAGFYCLICVLARHYLRISVIDRRLLSLAAASLVTFASYVLAPSTYAAYYWMSAAIPHTWSIALVMIYTSIFINRLDTKRNSAPRDWLIFLAFPVFIGLLYESAAVFVLLITLSIGGFLFFRKKNLRFLPRPIWLSLAAALISVGFLLFSPGTAARLQSNSGGLASALPGYSGAVWGNLVYNVFQTMRNELVLVIIFGLGVSISLFCLARNIPLKRVFCYAILVIAAAILGITVNISTLWFGVRSPLMPRSFFSTIAIIVLATLLLGVFLGQIIKQLPLTARRITSWSVTIGALFCIVWQGAYFPYLARAHSQFKSFAHVWDKRSVRIQADTGKRQCLIKVPAISINGIDSIHSDPTFWTNKYAVGHYYQIAEKLGQSCGVVADGNTSYYFY